MWRNSHGTTAKLIVVDFCTLDSRHSFQILNSAPTIITPTSVDPLPSDSHRVRGLTVNIQGSCSRALAALARCLPSR